MKKHLFLLIFTIFFSSAFTQNSDISTLLAPTKTGGMPLMEALNNRASNRDFSKEELSKQQISNLLWAAWGINRENGKHTAPSSRNKQEIEVYLSSKDGLFLYIPENHSLKRIHKTDIRNTTGKQAFTNEAPINLIYVANYKTAGSNSEEYITNSCLNVGFISQNVA